MHVHKSCCSDDLTVLLSVSALTKNSVISSFTNNRCVLFWNIIHQLTVENQWTRQTCTVHLPNCVLQFFPTAFKRTDWLNNGSLITSESRRRHTNCMHDILFFWPWRTHDWRHEQTLKALTFWFWVQPLQTRQRSPRRIQTSAAANVLKLIKN